MSGRLDERSYQEGSRRAWLLILGEALRQLGVDDPAAGSARWVLERQETVARLRGACAEHGDNEWTDDLHLADVVEKHLLRYLETRVRSAS